VLEQLTERIYSACGEKFNINSTQQLSKILFEKTQSYRGKKDKDGYSTDVMVLEELRGAHPSCELLLEYRQIQN